VKPEGNRKAVQVMETVFEPCDAEWRGLGSIPGSGLTFRREFAEFGARKRFRIAKRQTQDAKRRTACRCGDVMLGVIVPPECRLFAKTCTPETPVGPCMVSTEGACAAYYKYEREPQAPGCWPQAGRGAWDTIPNVGHSGHVLSRARRTISMNGRRTPIPNDEVRMTNESAASDKTGRRTQ
jgi:hypothetical protein